MTPREELEMLEELAALEGAKRPLAKDIPLGAYQGAKKGAAALIGLPADAINLVTQSLPRAVGGAPFLPPMGGTSRDAEGLMGKAETAMRGSPVPPPETLPGRVASAATSGLVTPGGAVPRLAGAAGQTMAQLSREFLPEQEWLANSLAVAPFAAAAGWQGVRPRTAEKTARYLTSNITPNDLLKSDMLRREFAQYGGKSTIAQTMPESSGMAGQANALVRNIEHRPLIDALVAQEKPLQNIPGLVKTQRDALYRTGDKIHLTRASAQALEAKAAGLPKDLAIAPATRPMREATAAVTELRNLLAVKPTARELSVHADALNSRANVVPGMGPFYPALAGQVAGAARTAAPGIAEADRLVGRTAELTEALSRVGLPPVMSLARKSTSPAADLAIASGASLTGHKLLAAGAFWRGVKNLVTGNPEAKLAAALASDRPDALMNLAKASRIKDVSPEVLRSAIQLQLQNGVKDE